MSEQQPGRLVAATSGTEVLTADEIRAQVQRVQQVMAAVMEEGTHYGTITRDGKPSLWKAGSEVLLSTFRIAVEPEVEDLGNNDEIRYRVTARGRHIPSGLVVGAGVGEASSSEEKYKWRAAVCDDEFDETPEDRRRIKYSTRWGERRGERVTERTQQVRTNPSDLANTILKMAKKRAQIDLTLTALAASDCFTQDLDDEDGAKHPTAGEDTRKIRPRTSPPKPTGEPSATSSPSSATSGAGAADPETQGFVEEMDRAEEERQPVQLATGKQIGLVKARLQDRGIAFSALCAEFEIGELEELRRADVDRALAWIKAGGPSA